MPLLGYPKTGQILMCDFDRGSVPPEMVKRRPVVVVSPSESHSRKLCTVIPLSSTPPTPAKAWHYALQESPLVSIMGNAQTWAKCDMIYTVSFDRLDKPHRRTRNGREYVSLKLSPADMAGVIAGVRAYLPLFC